MLSQTSKSAIDPMPVVKANAYGLGLEAVMPEFMDYRRLCVSTLDEATELRALGYAHTIMVMGTLTAFEAMEAVKLKLVPMVHNLRTLYALVEARAPVLNLHFDTGMGRMGLDPREAESITATIDPGVEIYLSTHFANADIDHPHNGPDRECWARLCRNLPCAMRHSANSAAAARNWHSADTHFRPGIGMWGVVQCQEMKSLQQALRLQAPIIEVRQLKAGTSLSYGHEFTTTRDSLIGVCPIGYADGIPVGSATGGSANLPSPVLHRRQTNDKPVHPPIVGRVTMDTVLVDLTDTDMAADAFNNELQWLELIGHNSVNDWAQSSGRTPYEILTHLGPRIQRELVATN